MSRQTWELREKRSSTQNAFLFSGEKQHRGYIQPCNSASVTRIRILFPFFAAQYSRPSQRHLNDLQDDRRRS